MDRKKTLGLQYNVLYQHKKEREYNSLPTNEVLILIAVFWFSWVEHKLIFGVDVQTLIDIEIVLEIIEINMNYQEIITVNDKTRGVQFYVWINCAVIISSIMHSIFHIVVTLFNL